MYQSKFLAQTCLKVLHSTVCISVMFPPIFDIWKSTPNFMSKLSVQLLVWNRQHCKLTIDTVFSVTRPLLLYITSTLSNANHNQAFIHIWLCILFSVVFHINRCSLFAFTGTNDSSLNKLTQTYLSLAKLSNSSWRIQRNSQARRDQRLEPP